jgi:alkylation response protein AidB-like acyl-CoA dehydrogenase
VDSILSDDQTALEEACRDLLANEWPLDRALKVLGRGGAGHSPELWSQLVATGWLGLPFAPELGGAGGNLVDLGLVYRAAGEHLVPASLYSSIFALLLIEKLGTPDQTQTLMPAIIGGERMATVAYSEPKSANTLRYMSTVAERTGSGWTLSGIKSFVPYLDLADVVLVLARTRSNRDREGWGVFRIEAAAVTGGMRRLSTFGGEALFELTLDHVTVAADALLGGETATMTTESRFADVVESATALQCMEMVGGTKAVIDRTVAYVSERNQGGRVLGAYQAVQHILANVSTQLHGARIATLKALDFKAKGRAAPREVSIAKVAAGTAYSNGTVAAHQVWGAMGYARETGLYLWAERAKVTDVWFGSRPAHLRALADRMGL